MIVRQARIADAEAIASCLLLAMEEIVYGFIGTKEPASALDFMRHFTQGQNNQYSWQNCWVVESEGAIVGAVNVYDGAALHLLRQPVIDYIQTHYNKSLLVEDETEAGEFYIDSVGVLPACRGAGIGTNLLQFLINEYVGKNGQTLGLLVEKENLGAQRLYQKLGFQLVSDRVIFGKPMLHLRCWP